MIASEQIVAVLPARPQVARLSRLAASGTGPGGDRAAHSPRRPRPAWPRWSRVQVLAGAPGTLIYLFTLRVTWWTLRGATPRLGHRLIISASTNLHNLAHDPVQVLIASAFWESGSRFPWQLILEFLLVMVAAEGWLGTRAWLATFAAGHVGATLITAIGLAYAVRHGLLPVKIADASDVGTSYGFYAVAALLTFRFTPRWRLAAAGGLILYLVISAWHGQTFTDYGHLAAMSIGFASYPVRLILTTFGRRRRDRTAGARRTEPSAEGILIVTVSGLTPPEPAGVGAIGSRSARQSSDDADCGGLWRPAGSSSRAWCLGSAVGQDFPTSLSHG